MISAGNFVRRRLQRFRSSQPSALMTGRRRSWKLLRAALECMSDIANEKSSAEAIPATEAMVATASALAALYSESSREREVLERMIGAGQDLRRDLSSSADRKRLNADAERLVEALRELLPATTALQA